MKKKYSRHFISEVREALVGILISRSLMASCTWQLIASITGYFFLLRDRLFISRLKGPWKEVLGAHCNN